jgi:peptidoglycan hydrolase-like protein with peptidoglycan-binding domain
MSRDDDPNAPDPDDWFSEPDVSESLREQPATTSTEVIEVDDWLDASAASAPRRRRRGGGGMSANTRAGIVIAAVLLVLLLIGLAVGGVFSSGGKNATPPLFTISTHTSTTGTTTTPTTPTGVAAPTTTLKPGDKGPQVTLLQHALAHLGYPPGTIDGQYGPATTQAVKNFQTAHGLTADGVCGPKTITALKNALTSG